MTHQKSLMASMRQVQNKIQEEKPLIHCITNAISINDCANAVLALGGKPIMAEHPKEVAEITVHAKALALNLGNISDSRMEAMMIAGKTAHQQKVPIILDLVGVGCSTLRREYAADVIKSCMPQVIKGNMSEMRAIAKTASHAEGIDVGTLDLVTKENLEQSGAFLKHLAKELGAVLVATGVIDLVTDGSGVYAIYNGHEMLGKITGTGCMVNVMIATFLAGGNILSGALLGTLMMGIAGARAAAKAKSVGSFHVALLDALYEIHDLDEASFEELMI